VSPEVLSLAGPSALCVYVGKQAGYHTRSQGEIHSLLLTFAQQGATVVR
jgi:uroporphyrin-III C-methyltransferase/precorrin-2 dehydrogenase/sirohydrochlorin ferrochelatase/uroporphyrin-III C-methyltransferase